MSYLNQLTNLTSKVLSLEQQYTKITEELDALEIQEEEINTNIVRYEKALLLTKICIDEFLKKKEYIERLISEGLSSVFNENYTFLLELQYDSEGLIKGIKPKIKAGDGEFDDPLDSFGGGAHVVINLCFRVAVLILTNETQPVLVMDEPLANLALDLQPQITKFIEETCKATKVQLIVITHAPNPFGKVYKVEKHKGISKCYELN